MLWLVKCCDDAANQVAYQNTVDSRVLLYLLQTCGDDGRIVLFCCIHLPHLEGLRKFGLTVNLGAKKGTTDLHMWTISDAVCVQGCKKKCFSLTFLSLKLVERRNK